jgi:Cu+-exporting ATPase
MALEPMLPREDENDGGEVRTMTRRFWLLVAFTLPVFLLAMGPHLFGWQLPSRWDGITHWVEAVLGTAVVLWGGAPFFQRGWNSLRPWRPNMYTLIGVGTGVAWLYSVVAFVLPGIFPASFRDVHGQVGVYFETAAVIVTLVTLGDFLELRARRRTGAALKARWGWRRRPRIGWPTTAARATCHWLRCMRVIPCAFAPAKRCRSMAWCSTARAMSTNRCSPASRCR